LKSKTTQTKEVNVSRRLFSNVTLNFLGQGFLLALSFGATPFIVHHLGAEFYGIVTLVQSVAGFAGLLNLGIGRALAKYVSELYWKRDVIRINQLFQTAWACCIVCGLAGAAMLVGPEQAIKSAFFHSGPEINEKLITYAIYVAALGLFSSMLFEAISAIPLAAQRFGFSNAINVLVGTVASGGSVVLLAAGYSVRSVLLINLISNVIGLIAYVIFSRGLIPELRLLPKLNLIALRELLAFSLPLLLSAISALIVNRVDRFILAYYLPLSAVAFYTLPYSISDKLSLGVGNVVSVVFPLASELHSRGAHDKIHELYFRSTRILVLITLPLTVILLTIPWPILEYWLGVEYAAQGATSLSLLGAAAFLNALSAVPTVTSLGVGRPWVPSAFAFASSAISLIANFLLIPRYGINGAALAQLLPQVAVVPFFILAVNRILNLHSWRLVSEALLRPFACAIIEAVFLIEFRPYIGSLISLLILILMSLGLFAVLALFGAISRDERLALFRLLFSR
jgi:O-antigen/teichoic acid export membrane protein